MTVLIKKNIHRKLEKKAKSRKPIRLCHFVKLPCVGGKKSVGGIMINGEAGSQLKTYMSLSLGKGVCDAAHPMLD